MTSIYVIVFFFIVFNLICISNFSRIRIFHSNIDKPDQVRKLHSKPTPLAGGIIIYLNLICYWGICIFNKIIFSYQNNIFLDFKSLNYFILISSLIFLLGFIDDKFNLKANLKFLILLIIISMLLFIDKSLIIDDIKITFYDGIFILNSFGIFFTTFCFLVFINAFNMFDGINLQSSSYSLIIFFCILFFYSNSLLVNIIIISLLGFSYLNYKNKTFLGDSGSLLLSFIIGYLFIKLYNFNIITYADKIVLYMLIPGLDLIRLFVVRIMKNKNPLNPDRNHLHHILSKKYSYEKALISILILISVPIILDYLNFNTIFSILITIFIYLFLIKIKKR